MFGFFTWLRHQTKQAVLGGLADAASEISDGESDPAKAIAGFQAMLRPALPAPVEEAKEEDSPAQANGKRSKAKGGA